MDTLRVDICYRPLRIAWAIRRDDWDSLRRAIRYSHALWGGRFNPIIVADDEVESREVVEAFRADFVLPIGSDACLRDIASRFSYLIRPYVGDGLFQLAGNSYTSRAHALDMQNALAFVANKPIWASLVERGVRDFTWEEDDPLATVLLAQLGAFPDPAEVGEDYRSAIMGAFSAQEHRIVASASIPREAVVNLSASRLNRATITSHWSIHFGQEQPGFFVGSAGSFSDLVCFWNLRARDIPLWFIDLDHFSRYSGVVPEWTAVMRQHLVDRHQPRRRDLAIWSRGGDVRSAVKVLGVDHPLLVEWRKGSWGSKDACVPMMYLGQAAELGVVSRTGGKPRVSYSLTSKPFSDDPWFAWQHLVASCQFVGGLFGDEHYTLDLPYIPELNEPVSREMVFRHNQLRLEPGRLGIVVDAAATDCTLSALPVGYLFERVFELAGFKAKPSSAGLIVRQVAARLGGSQGGRVFKIPGVRRLLKAFGPGKSFSKKVALQFIGGKDPERPDAKFSDHEGLFIEARREGGKLTPGAVLGFLVEKGLLRAGFDLTCPECRLGFWSSIDETSDRTRCEMCGTEVRVARQLTDRDELRFRRSGFLGREKNAQGAIPVALTIQQLMANLMDLGQRSVYSPSLDLEPLPGASGGRCEVDFAWLAPGDYPRLATLVVGECKDCGPIDGRDIENLGRIADAFPESRFETFVVLSQLVPFSRDQVESARALNKDDRRRAILLTAQELEPFYLYERRPEKDGRHRHAFRPQDMAEATSEIFFGEP